MTEKFVVHSKIDYSKLGYFDQNVNGILLLFEFNDCLFENI